MFPGVSWYILVMKTSTMQETKGLYGGLIDVKHEETRTNLHRMYLVACSVVFSLCGKAAISQA